MGLPYIIERKPYLQHELAKCYVHRSISIEVSSDLPPRLVPPSRVVFIPSAPMPHRVVPFGHRFLALDWIQDPMSQGRIVKLIQLTYNKWDRTSYGPVV